MNKFEIETSDSWDWDEDKEIDVFKCPYCKSIVLSSEGSIQPCKHVASYAYDEGVEYVHPDFIMNEELRNGFDSFYKGFTIAVTLYFAGKYNEGKVYHLEGVDVDSFIGFFNECK